MKGNKEFSLPAIFEAMEITIIIIIIIIIIPLFTLGCIYSTNASGAKQMPEIELNRIKNPNWSEANQLAIYKHGRGLELGLL